jgi:hypothetical protein
MESVRPVSQDFSPFSVKGRARVYIWIFLLAITVALILLPANLKYEYSIHAIPFLYIFDSLSLFAVMYYIWLAVLLVLLFTRGSEGAVDWEKAALVGIFALIFSGYSTLMTHGYIGDSFTPAGDIKNLAVQGFNLASQLKYHGFPGFSLLGTGVCLVTGMEITDYMPFFPLFQILLFSILLYLFFNKLLRNPYLASLGALLVVQLDISVSANLAGFHGGAFAPFCLLPAVLLLFTRSDNADNRRWSRFELRELLILVLLLALFVSHFVTSVAAVLTILSIYVLQRINKRRVLSVTLLVVALLVPVIWNLVENMAIVRYLADTVNQAMADLASGQFISESLLPMQTSSYTGGRSPLWAVLPLYLGPLLVIAGGVLGLARLFKIKNLETSEVIALGGLVGIGVLAIMLLLLGSLQESYGRAFTYIALFTTPFILWRVIYLKKIRNVFISLLAIILFSFSLPAFFLNSKAVAGSTYYPRETASGEFLEATYGDGSGLHIFGMEGSGYYLTYYLPHAFRDLVYPPDFRSKDAGEIWLKMNEYVTDIEEEDRTEEPVWVTGDSIIMFSPKWETPFRDYLGLDVKGSPKWQQLQSRLEKYDSIYSNGFVRIYRNIP